MIFKLFSYFDKNDIRFCLVNGYKDVVEKNNTDSDIDLLLKRKDFLRIESLLKDFCEIECFQLIQVLHHDLLAKNIFLFNPADGEFLNLDLYGELSRKSIVIEEEETVFSSLEQYEGVPILSAENEFINYLIKKLDKNDLTEMNFSHLHSLYLKSEDTCKQKLEKYGVDFSSLVINAFSSNSYSSLISGRDALMGVFYEHKPMELRRLFFNGLRFLKRVIKPTGLTISFLGPDGSGKSTIIDALEKAQLPFRRVDYFHLKPIKTVSQSSDEVVVSEPHKYPPYSAVKSYLKLLFFVGQYNKGWVKNISALKIRSSLVIFDRYFDDLLVDTRRYRYGGRLKVARRVKSIIPRPEVYFILTAAPDVIYGRKQEVPYEELERQVEAYDSIADGKRYVKVDVDRSVDDIVKEIIVTLMERMHVRF
ncbi:MAG: hypothetical protein HRU20_03125 [Pseudomonadales bacterium]|nr:hypothetical protein [Pseudomonadales bacterium]